MDVVGVLTDSLNPRKYWSVLKTRLKKEGSELATNCSQLKMRSADGKSYLTDVADTEQLFRYNKDGDYYVCPMGQRMNRIGTRRNKTASGYTTESTRYRAQRCDECPLVSDRATPYCRK